MTNNYKYGQKHGFVGFMPMSFWIPTNWNDNILYETKIITSLKNQKILANTKHGQSWDGFNSLNYVKYFSVSKQLTGA